MCLAIRVCIYSYAFTQLIDKKSVNMGNTPTKRKASRPDVVCMHADVNAQHGVTVVSAAVTIVCGGGAG